MVRILLKNVISNEAILLSDSAFRVQLSHPYVSIDTTRLLWSCIFVAILMLLLLHIFLSFAIAEVTMFIRVRISSGGSPSVEMIDPRYLNDVTSSRHSPFINNYSSS